MELEDLSLGLAYAATGVNATIFRHQALVSDAQFQYATYYDAEGYIVVAKRKLNEYDWERYTLPMRGNVGDAHNCTVLGLSADGVLHLAYDQHNHPLRYRRTKINGDIRSFGEPETMTGTLESHVCYPSFIRGHNREFFFFYRDGMSGNGRLCLNGYDANTQTWRSLQKPLIEGTVEGGKQSSPYWWRPEISSGGAIHIAWCWRASPDASTNYDLCYIRSRDGGQTWQNSAGQTLQLPVTAASDVTVRAIRAGSNLLNQCAMSIDTRGYPHIAYYSNDESGTPQYQHLYFDGSNWINHKVSRRTLKFSLGGAGSLQLPVSRPEITITKTGTVYLLTKDDEFGGGFRLYRANAPFDEWEAVDVLTEQLGNWEPSYDWLRWQRDDVLSVFVLPVRQGNHETTTDFPPQMARVVEMSGL